MYLKQCVKVNAVNTECLAQAAEQIKGQGEERKSGFLFSLFFEI